MNGRELAALVPLVACMFWVGLYPQFFLDRITPSVRPIEKLLLDRRQYVMKVNPQQWVMAAGAEAKQAGENQ